MMKLPIMLRKTYEAQEKKLRFDLEMERRRLERKKEIEIEYTVAELRDVIGRLSKLAIVKDHRPESPEWRVIVDLDANMICRALERGNDNKMIEYIGDVFKHKVIAVLCSQNIQRPKDVLGRG